MVVAVVVVVCDDGRASVCVRVLAESRKREGKTMRNIRRTGSHEYL